MSEPVVIPPKLADVLISAICAGLESKLSWLDVAFGRAERITKEINGKKYLLPVIYNEESPFVNEYTSLSPDSQIGNFSFFWMMDPQILEWRPRIRGNFRDPFALIFWVDLRKVYGKLNDRNIYNIEDEVLKVLNSITLPTGSLSINKIYHLPEQIYREFSLESVENQFLMHPYAGFRLEGDLYYEQPC